MAPGMIPELEEVEARLASAAVGVAPEQAAGRKRYHGSSLIHHGLTMPVQRAIAKKGFSFSGEELPRQLKIWSAMWQAKTSLEARNQALLFCGNHCRPETYGRFWPVLKRWARSVDCWVDADGLSGHLSAIHEARPGTVYPTFAVWNQARDPWLRRLSIVSLIYYAGLRRHYPPVEKILPLVEALLSDRDHFVQRGVGWSLRECGSVYPRETWRFLQAQAPLLSAIAFSAATEKIDSARKERLKAKRKAARRNRIMT